jgi:hypothetical protein
MTSTTLKTLPPRVELDSAAKALMQGFDAVEASVIQIKNVGGEWVTGEDDHDAEIPTLEQVGLVFSFKSEVESYISLLQREAAILDVALEGLNSLRLDADARAGRRANV